MRAPRRAVSIKRLRTAPCLSVIMAVHRAEPFVAQAIESIALQTFGDYEFIIIDDAADESSLKLLKQWQRNDGRIRLVRNGAHRGLPQSLNIGLAQAKGMFIARMDADDVSDRRRFERQITFLRKKRDIAIVGTGTDMIDDAGTVRGTIPLPTTPQETAAFVPDDNPFVHSSVMVRADAVKSLGGYDELFTYSQDFELWCRLLLFYRGANVPGVLHHKRTHDGAISTQRFALQRLYCHAVQGRYTPLYDSLRRREKKVFFTRALGLFCRVHMPTCLFVYQRLCGSTLSAREKLACINQGKMVPLMHGSLRKDVLALLETIRKPSAHERYQYASLLEQEGRHKESSRHFQTLTTERDRQLRAGALYHLGLLSLKRRCTSDALVFFEQCLKVLPEHQRAAACLRHLAAKGAVHA